MEHFHLAQTCGCDPPCSVKRLCHSFVFFHTPWEQQSVWCMYCSQIYKLSNGIYNAHRPHTTFFLFKYTTLQRLPSCSKVAFMTVSSHGDYLYKRIKTHNFNSRKQTNWQIKSCFSILPYHIRVIFQQRPLICSFRYIVNV
jgi:hypothetical protein